MTLRRAATRSKSATEIKRFASHATSIRRESETLTIRSRTRRRPRRRMGGLTGRAVPKIPATAEGLSTPHVMRPFETKLNYNGKPWSTVRLKVGHSEIGGIEEADYYIAPDIIEILRLIGPPNPDPITYISLRHHISQKPVDGAIAWGVEQAHRRQSEDLINERTVPPPCFYSGRSRPTWSGLIW